MYENQTGKLDLNFQSGSRLETRSEDTKMLLFIAYLNIRSTNIICLIIEFILFLKNNIKIFNFYAMLQVKTSKFASDLVDHLHESHPQ